MSTEWKVGQTVDVQSRTWAGINKPGGCAKVVQVHYAADGKNIESLDVKYILGGGREKEIDPAIVSAYENLERGGRKRRGRDFLMSQTTAVVKAVATVVTKQHKKNKSSKKSSHPTTTPLRRTRDAEDSTSPSTPVTPDRPLTHSKSKKKKTHHASRSTSSSISASSSVPTIIIADSALEVSPLPLDRAVVPKNKVSDVRRGLFGTSNKHSESNLATKQKTHSNNSTFQRKPKGKENIKVSRSPDTSNTARQRNPLTDRPTKAGASRKLHSATTSSSTATQSHHGTQKALKEVFDYELRKARAFLDEVCNGANPETETVPQVSQTTTSKPITTTATNILDQKPPARETSKPSKREQFLSLFRNLRPKFDDEDGTMEEDVFRSHIMKNKDFTNQEVQEHLQFLCDDGRLMQSDGILYIID